MFGFVDLEAGNRAVGDAGVVVDECHWAHDPTHAQCSNQLIACHACAIDRDFGQTIVATGERHVLGGGEPVAHEVLAHAQAQAADDHHAQPPVVEDDGTGDDGLVVAVPVDDECQDQRGQTDSLDDGYEGLISEIAHHGSIHAKADEEWDGDYRRAGEQPEMNPKRVVHIINAKANDKSKPECRPDEQYVCEDLNQSFLPPRQPQ